MATSQDLPGKKPATKTTTTLTVKKTPAKKVATPAATKATVAKVPVAKIPASKAAEPSKAAATKATANKQAINAPVAKPSVSPEDRYKMIAAAAYSKAEHRGFASGYALNDWIAAEKEIDRMLEAQVSALA